MWRVVVFYALFWLGANNILYKDVIINHEEIANWEDEFVSRSVKDNIILSLSDHSEHKSYTHDLSEDNLVNDMYVAISDWNKLQSGLFSGCLFTDIDGIHHHPILKLIFAVNNLANNNDEKTKPLIVYSANGHCWFITYPLIICNVNLICDVLIFVVVELSVFKTTSVA